MKEKGLSEEELKRWAEFKEQTKGAGRGAMNVSKVYLLWGLGAAGVGLVVGVWVWLQVANKRLNKASLLDKLIFLQET